MEEEINSAIVFQGDLPRYFLQQAKDVPVAEWAQEGFCDLLICFEWSPRRGLLKLAPHAQLDESQFLVPLQLSDHMTCWKTIISPSLGKFESDLFSE